MNEYGDPSRTSDKWAMAYQDPAMLLLAGVCALLSLMLLVTFLSAFTHDDIHICACNVMIMMVDGWCDCILIFMVQV